MYQLLQIQILLTSIFMFQKIFVPHKNVFRLLLIGNITVQLGTTFSGTLK